MSREKNRHWYILRIRGEDRIRCLLSAFSEDHIRRKIDIQSMEYPHLVFIEKAKRWHISKVFSGVPVFKEYKSNFLHEDVESYVSNGFHMIMDGKKTLVKVLS